MKKALAFLLVFVMAFSFVACKNDDPDPTPDPDPDPQGTVYKVANLINGKLGDKSFFDSCHAGLTTLESEGRIDYTYKELGAEDSDQPAWLQALEDFSEEGTYDVIICGTYQMNEYLTQVAAAYPDQMYLIYDSEVSLPNVCNINYKQNDMGYLIGVFAASMTSQTDIDNINEDAVIGFVGGEDGPVINDFLYGYILGAQSVNPDIKIDTRYVGNFYDTTAGKELALNMINDNNCDIVWGVAGLVGTGVAEACYDANAWFVGVDADQELTLNDPNLQGVTLTSGLKNIGDSMIWFFDEMDAGNLHYGENIQLGIEENGVGVVTDKNFANIAPQAVQDAVLAAQQDILNGTVTVPSTFDNSGAGNDDLVALREAVKP